MHKDYARLRRLARCGATCVRGVCALVVLRSAGRRAVQTSRAVNSVRAYMRSLHTHLSGPQARAGLCCGRSRSLQNGLNLELGE
eukprot:5464997-Pyramimonas_sp.AAC.1